MQDAILSAKEKKRLAILDNRAGELAEWEPDVLAELNTEGLLDGLWYENEINNLLGNVSPDDPNELWKNMPEFENAALVPIQSIYVHFYSDSDRESFSKLVKQPITEKTKYINFPYIEPENLKQYIITNES